MNQMMMANMYQQGNMMLGNMYPNMMMPGSVLGGGMMQPTSMDMMQGTGMDLMSQSTIDMSSMTGSQTMAPTGTGAMDMTMMSGMMMDPSIMGMYSTMGTDNMSVVLEKKEMVLKHCKLIPPDPGVTQPPKKARPPGCRTIFVGGLPDKIRESTVREIFEMYGRIHTLRLSKKNFCHIRFDRETCVDDAMAISGYRIKLLSKDKDESDDEDSHATSGWLHVDYALSRDDQNEYERRQRQALRAQQAQMQQLTAQQEMVSRSSSSSRKRSPSPLRIQPFSNTSIVQLAEKIKSEEQFSSTLPTLISWLERGECSKKNSNQFYSMIQATNSHIRRLFNEKMQSEEELQECKERIKNHIQGIIDQQTHLSLHNIQVSQEIVSNGSAEVKHPGSIQITNEFTTLKEEFHEKFNNEESEFNGLITRPGDGHNEDLQLLKRENESLSFQLEAYKNEVDVIKSEAQKEMEKFKAQFIARQALQEAMEKNPPLPASPVVKPPPPPPLPDELNDKVVLNETVEAGCGEAKLIGIMSAFLQVHPKGASLDYVVSYVRALFPAVSQATVHHVLNKHHDVFRVATTGVGANIEHRWYFIAFNQINE